MGERTDSGTAETRRSGAPLGLSTPPRDHPLFLVAKQITKYRARLRRQGLEVEIDPFARGVELVHYRRGRSRRSRNVPERRQLVALVRHIAETGQFRVGGREMAEPEVVPAVLELARAFNTKRRRGKGFFSRWFAWG